MPEPYFDANPSDGAPLPPARSTTGLLKRAITRSLRALSLAVLVVGIGFATLACIQWLQTAHWQPLTVQGALAKWPTTREWTVHPRSWLGLHRIVAWTLRIPVFVVVTLVGVALVIFGAQTPESGPTAHSSWSTR